MKNSLLMAGICLALLTGQAFSDNGDDTLGFYLSKSDTVLAGTILNEPDGVSKELGVPCFHCAFKVSDVLKGDAKLKGTTVKVSIVRFEMDAKDHHPLIRKDAEVLLFLKPPTGSVPVFETADVWFGVGHPFPWLIRSLKRLVQEPSLNRYLGASWEEQAEQQGAVIESAADIVPVALSRLGAERFSREKVRRGSHAPARHAADALRMLAETKPRRDRVIEAVKPLLKSKNRNERGWANYVLGGQVYYAGELDPMPDLLLQERDDDVRWAILDRLHYSLANNPEAGRIKTAKSDWQTELVNALGATLASEDDPVLELVGKCLREIPSARSTELAVETIRNHRPGSIHLVGLLRQRVGVRHPAALTREQQEAVAGTLIRMKMDAPGAGSDTLTDVLKDIPDRRVLPAFFRMLEKHGSHRGIQRQASYCIWILFTHNLRKETPREIYDMSDLNEDPLRSGAAWRRWYRENGDRLVWDAASGAYRLQEKPSQASDQP